VTEIQLLMEMDHEWVLGWNSEAMTDKDMEAVKKLGTELEKKKAHLDERIQSKLLYGVQCPVS
jgi:hypothetical protein